MMLIWYITLCFITHLCTSPKLRTFAAIDHPYKYSLSFNLLSPSSFNLLSIRFNIDIFFFSSNNMTWAFFCLAFLAFVSDFRFLLFIWSTGSTSSNSSGAASSFWTFSSQLSSSSYPVKTEMLSGMLHLVLLGFRYTSS